MRYFSICGPLCIRRVISIDPTFSDNLTLCHVFKKLWIVFSAAVVPKKNVGGGRSTLSIACLAFIWAVQSFDQMRGAEDERVRSFLQKFSELSIDKPIRLKIG
jgi:hypothetical protein